MSSSYHAYLTGLLHPAMQIECAYHGWQFDGDGSCTKMPSTLMCRNVAVSALPCVEKDGFIWVWPGEGVPPEVRLGSRRALACHKERMSHMC
jgi:phenylpropionate dioxygenase-like ring-hydroxylating dioxygenase large terminal subunit